MIAPRDRARRKGFGLSLGLTLLWTSLIVALPIAALVLKSAGLSASEWRTLVLSPRALAAYRLTLLTALAASAINAVAGLVVAWVLVRYEFPWRGVFDALIDFPFALPTAVAGLAFADLYGSRGWIGRWLRPLGLLPVFTPVGIVLVLVFVTLPFVVRSLQPVIQEMEPEFEEAAYSMGASRWQTFRHVIAPALLPAWLTGFALALSRAIGEYGSVVFISGNLPFRTEIAAVLVVMQLEQYNARAAAAIGTVMLFASFVLLAIVHGLERWSQRHA